jgi:hypothetical protein
MARLFLSPGQTFGTIGGFDTTDVIGTNDFETVFLAADALAVFDGSFNRGGDSLHIDGNASAYTATLSGSTVILTADNGANIVIPVGVVGATIYFNDVEDGRVLYFDEDLGKVCLGDQTLEAGVDTVLAPGSTGGGGGGGDGETLHLTYTQDILEGTDGDDTFRAVRGPNGDGAITNYLQTGDFLDGGDGDDLLRATIQDDSPLNAGPISAVAPYTTDIETVRFTAQGAENTGSWAGQSLSFYEDYLGVEVNARDMLGVDQIGSHFSDTTLTIYNMNTLKDSGNLADPRLTEEITVCMDHTAPGDVINPAADLIVLFSQDFLLKQGDVTSGATLIMEIMDLDAAIEGRDPLEDNPFGQIVFTMDGEEYTLTFGNASNTYAELLADVQAALADLAADFPETATLSASLIPNGFTASDTDNDPGGSATGDTIVIVNSGPEVLEAVTMRAIGDAPAGKDFHTNFEAFEGDTSGFKVTVNVCLDKVGDGSDGGDLIIGGMSTNGYNVWDSGSGSKGIEQFIVSVESAYGEPGPLGEDSSLASMRSTNNTLKCVVIVDEGDNTASLTIGNSQTSYQTPGMSYNSEGVTTYKNHALKDVLIFNASAFDNGVEVHGFFSEETVAKYMDLTDTQANPADDNANALYSFGGGDDLLNMNLDESNMATVGTETREDFSFTADMGAGDDVVQIQIGNGFNEETVSNPLYSATYPTGTNGYQSVDNWYYNHVLNNNLRIDTGADDDTVMTWGATAADINLGSGHDTAYTDNSGVYNGAFNQAKATWVFNQLNVNVDDLQSETSAILSNVANLGLRVTFQGIESTLVVVANSQGSIDGVTVSDLQINQAIKDAINNDPVLSKLLVAEDGPARTLVVRSLIDGEHVVTDLTVTLDTTSALTTAQTAGDALLLADLDAAELAAMGFDTLGNVTGTRYDSEFGQDFHYNGSSTAFHDLMGFDSVNVNNNNVEGALGNDVIVLSSNGIGNGIGLHPSSTTIGNSVETLDINDLFGFDTVVNFTAADDGIYDTTPWIANAAADFTGSNWGFDIFDVTTIIGPVSFVENQMQLDGAEAGGVYNAMDNDGYVAITDTVEADDYAFNGIGAAAGATERDRIQEIATDYDTTTQTAPTDSIVITVNADNVGTFYHIHDGNAVGDVSVTLLGRIELAEYDNTGIPAKDAIGEWDGMTLTNFTPLTPDLTVTTFDIT